DRELLVAARRSELGEHDLRLHPGAGPRGPRARIAAAELGGVEGEADAEAVAVAVVVRIRGTDVVAVADAVAVGVDELTRRRAARVGAVGGAVVALLAAVDDAVAARFERAVAVTAVAVRGVAVVALLARIEEAVAAGRRGRTGRGDADQMRLLHAQALV